MLTVGIELGYDSDLYLNSSDEEHLAQKNEIERESILKQRFEKRQALLERYELLKRQRMRKPTAPLIRKTSKRSSRSSSNCSDCHRSSSSSSYSSSSSSS